MDNSTQTSQLDDELLQLFDCIVNTVTYYVPDGRDIWLHDFSKIDFSKCEVLNADNWFDQLITRATDMAHAFADSEPLIYDDLFRDGKLCLGMFFHRYMHNHRGVPVTFHCYMTRDGRDVLFTNEAHDYLPDKECYDFETEDPHSGSEKKGCLFGRILSVIGTISIIHDAFRFITRHD